MIECPRCGNGVDGLEPEAVYWVKPTFRGPVEMRDAVCSPCMVEVRAWTGGQAKARGIYTTSNRTSFGMARMILSGNDRQAQRKPRCKHGTAPHLECFACKLGM